MKVIVVTVCSHPDHPGLARLKRSLDRCGWNAEHITLPWAGFRTKLIGVRNFATEAKRRGYTHIIHLDAYDSLAYGTPADVERALSSTDYRQQGALLSCERACWPHPEKEKLYPLTAKSPWKHINSGHYLCNVDYVEELLSGCDDVVDDQAFLTDKFLADGGRMVFRDDGCDVFQSLAHQQTWQEAFEITGSRIKNHVTGSLPCFVHANGGGSSSNYHSWIPGFNEEPIANIESLLAVEANLSDLTKPETVSLTGWDILYHSELLNRSAWSNQPIEGETKKLRELCRKADPQVVVELGGRYGGTTLALYDAAPKASIFAFERDFSDGDKTIDWDNIKALNYLGYENEEYHTRRSWFKDGDVQFIKIDFVAECQRVKKIVDAKRRGRMFMFVDGDWGQKPVDVALYADWLRPGDVAALNNSHDIMNFTHPGNEWQIPDLEAMLLPRGFERFEFEWCGMVGMMLTRAWVKR